MKYIRVPVNVEETVTEGHVITETVDNYLRLTASGLKN